MAILNMLEMTVVGMERGLNMLSWALTFLVVALIAALLGFTGIAGTAMGIAQILFWVFVVLFLLSLVVALVRGKGPPISPI